MTDIADLDRHRPSGDSRVAGGWAALTAAPPTPVHRLHHYFETSCDRTPDATALECDGVRLTYSELDRRANRLAHHLIAAGIGPGTRTAIFLHRSVETYVAVLAVLKAGAAFVPIDPTSPQDRVDYITSDSAVDLMLTSAGLAPLTATSGCTVDLLDSIELEHSQLSQPTTRPHVPLVGDPAAYVIYTSGSSGRPKGVEVAQSSICNFIRVVPEVYGVEATDRVYQGMTIAFDFSIEEIWPTWAVGATLVAGPNDGRRLGSELADFLESNAVTMVYCVPTVLATIDRDLPGIHTLNVGGEPCPQELVDRWSDGGRRRILNTYGPTEATVTATWAELAAHRPVTIGRPLPTYSVYLLDESLVPVPDGLAGEICVGGPGVARGYVGRPQLTAERFVPNPFAEGGRLYRTGDLGRYVDGGEIEYLGRADSEVKVRGHRVDLQEIENVLREDDAVTDAIATLSSATQELAAYITKKSAQDADALIARVHDRMRRHLPPYMVPSHLMVMDALPMLPSGKADRKSLPAPRGRRLVSSSGPIIQASTPLERGVEEVWAQVLGLETGQVSIDADFFTDLGGHSLAAATVVSTLRRRRVADHLAIGDLYAHPTIRDLVGHVQSMRARAAVRRPGARRRRRQTSNARVVMSGIEQLGILYTLVLLFATPIAIVYAHSDGAATSMVLAELVAFIPLTYVGGRCLLPILASRLLSIGVRPGRYPLWGTVHLRVWTIQKLLEVSPARVLSGSPLLPIYLRLLGARVGQDTHLASAELSLPALTEIGDGVHVGYGASLRPFYVEDGWLVVGPVILGRDAFVGASSMVVAGAGLGPGAVLTEHSVLGPAEAIPSGEHWGGSPARPTQELDVALTEMTSCPTAPRQWSPMLMAGFAAGFFALELLPFAMIAPAVMLVWWALLSFGTLAGLAASVLSGPVYVLTACTLIAVLRRATLGTTPIGILHLRTSLGLRKWIVDKLLEASLAATNTLYSTVYTATWLRALGARVGVGAEVSTVAHLDPDLLILGPGSFVADMASVGSATFQNGHIALQPTEVGRRAFVGNAAFVPSGTFLGDRSLIGVHTVPPRGGVPADTSWLGAPAIFLPRRQESQDFGEAMTFHPSRRMMGERLFIEFFRITLPSSVLAVAAFCGLYAIAGAAGAFDLWATILAAPVAFLVVGLATVLVVVGIKWLLVGVYRPRVEPLWSRFVRRSELVTGLYEAAAVPALLQGLTGTPMIGPLLRLFGAKVGRRTFIDTTYLTEFDLVRIADDAAVGTQASLQTHLFEDRVMKMSTVTIESRASVGARSVVLYDAVVGRYATLGPLSLVMKGESLMPTTHWVGIPAQHID